MANQLGRITGESLNSSWKIGAAHALYRRDGSWYHHLTRFPGALFDLNGYVLFDTSAEYEQSGYLQHGAHLHVPGGIRNMPSYVCVTYQEP